MRILLTYLIPFLFISETVLAASPMRAESIISKGSVSIGTTNAADSKSLLDLVSTTKGMLAPRMTTAQRNAIATPPNGLIVFDTDLKTLMEYDSSGTAWRAVVTRDAAETLSNKTLNAPTIASGVVLTEESSTPTTPSSGFKKLYAKNDGKVYTLNSGGVEVEVGSGAGGGGGMSSQTLPNPGFDSDTANWTESGGSFSRTTTASLVGNNRNGSGGGVWNSNAAAQTLSTDATIPKLFEGQNGEAYCPVMTGSGTSTYVLELLDGSNVINSVTIASDTTKFAKSGFNFVFPTYTGSIPGTLTLRIRSVAADEPTIYFDDCYLGLATNVSDVKQSMHVGTLAYTGSASCVWQQTTNSGMVMPAAQPACAAPVVTGSVTAPSTRLPAADLGTLAPGYAYKITVNGTYAVSASASTVQCHYKLFLNNTEGKGTFMATLTTGENVEYGPISLSDTFVLTQALPLAQAQLRIQQSAGTGTCQILASLAPGRELSFQVEKFPIDGQQTYTPDIMNWRVDAVIIGSNPNLGNSAVASFAQPSDGSLSLTQYSGSLPVGITCQNATTSNNFASTCTASLEGPGIAFRTPRAGAYRACVSFSHEKGNGSAAGANINSVFRIVETTLAFPYTVTEQGKTNVPSRSTYEGGTGTAIEVTPLQICGTFQNASAGDKALRLEYMQGVTGTPTSNLLLMDNSFGNRSMHWEVYPIDQAIPAPLLVNSVVAPDYNGVTKINTIKSVSTNYTLTANDETVQGNTTSGNITITLPLASTVPGKKYTVTKPVTPNTITVAPTSPDTISSSTGTKIHAFGDSVTLQSDGTSWRWVSSAMRTEVARIACSGSSGISSQRGNWVSSVGNVDANGSCQVNFQSGIFDGAPVCNVNWETTTGSTSAQISTATASGVIANCRTSNTAAACSSISGQLTCSGYR